VAAAVVDLLEVQFAEAAGEEEEEYLAYEKSL
jgi:hypothetical protein